MKDINKMLNMPNGDSQFDLLFEGIQLNFKVRKESGILPLVIYFHGAIDRNKRKTPVFQPFLNITGCHQLSIYDPTLDIDASLRAGWYIGFNNKNIQKILTEFFKEIKRIINYSTLVFVGSSVGGFAALFFGSQFKDSYVLTFNPQTDITKYYPGHYKEFLSAAFPKKDESCILKNTFSLIDLYKDKCETNIYYYQSKGDDFHIKNHFLPFLQILPRELFLRSNFFFSDEDGHKPPKHIYLVKTLNKILKKIEIKEMKKTQEKNFKYLTRNYASL